MTVVTFLRLMRFYHQQWHLNWWNSLNAAWHTVRGDWD